jgi:hypothetical protein
MYGWTFTRETDHPHYTSGRSTRSEYGMANRASRMAPRADSRERVRTMNGSQEMPWVRRLVVAAAVFGLVGATAAPAMAQDEAVETAEEVPATFEEIVLADVAAQQAPVEEAPVEAAPVEEIPVEEVAQEAAPVEQAAQPVDESAPVAEADTGDQALVPAEEILPVPDPVAPAYMTPEELI